MNYSVIEVKNMYLLHPGHQKPKKLSIMLQEQINSEETL